jgi:protein-S-isoprenylcysteine O-methyltransferase Ste14
MTTEQLILIAGAVLAVLFAYIPGLASWFEPLENTKKRLIMLGILIVVTGAIFGLSCAGILSSVTCDKAGAISLVTALIYAIVANQGTYQILPKVGLNK